jgi:RsiW-degrading membrane proteinase PrsW (M82 family)
VNANVQVALSGVIPALVAMWVVDRLDRKRPEPARTRRMVAFVGMLSVIPAILLEQVLTDRVGAGIGPQFTYQGASYNAFIVAAAVEEACKIAVVYWIVWRKPSSTSGWTASSTRPGPAWASRWWRTSATC